MKYAILADIHGNLEAFQAALKDAAQQHCTHYCCLGDLVGYGANPVECLELVRTGNMPCVRGDHDEYGSSEGPLDMFGPHAAEALVWTRQQLSAPDRQWLRDLKYIRLVANFCLVHATLDQPHRWAGVFDKLMAAASFTYQTTSVCFCGHTHVPTAFVRDAVLRGGTYSKFKVEPNRKYFVNVGSVGQPWDGNPQAAYVVYDLDESTIEVRRLDYDVLTAQRKILAAGLPPLLASRLPLGQSEDQPWGSSVPAVSASAIPEPPRPAHGADRPSVWQRLRSWVTRPPLR